MLFSSILFNPTTLNEGGFMSSPYVSLYAINWRTTITTDDPTDGQDTL